MSSKSPITTLDIQARKHGGEKLVAVTAYDATFARLCEQAGADILLVGDSLGMVIQGHESTLPVTLDHMIYHAAAVTRVAKRAHVVVDLPFMSYQVSVEQALTSAGALVQRGGAHAVKLEGGRAMTAQIRGIVQAGIPVMGHIGLTPQSMHQLGGYKVQGRNVQAARKLMDEAVAVAEAGAYALVLEGVPQELAQRITEKVAIPTIGIGAGASCDGQVLVSYDLLGMNPAFNAKFLKTYASLAETIVAAVGRYAEEVRAGSFPTAEHSFKNPELLHADLSKPG